MDPLLGREQHQFVTSAGRRRRKTRPTRSPRSSGLALRAEETACVPRDFLCVVGYVGRGGVGGPRGQGTAPVLAERALGGPSRGSAPRCPLLPPSRGGREPRLLLPRTEPSGRGLPGAGRSGTGDGSGASVAGGRRGGPGRGGVTPGRRLAGSGLPAEESGPGRSDAPRRDWKGR